jgi:hypothetical protein
MHMYVLRKIVKDREIFSSLEQITELKSLAAFELRC